MPVFVCSRCKHLENTATSRYVELVMTGADPLCSECDSGSWHGKFERTAYDPKLHPDVWTTPWGQPESPDISS